MSFKKESAFLWIGLLGVALLSFVVDVFFGQMIGGLHPSVLDGFFEVVTNFILLVFVFVTLPLIWIWEHHKKGALLIGETFVISFFASYGLKVLFLRARPEEAAFVTSAIIPYSFPSTHAMVSFAMVSVLVFLFPKQKAYWVMAAVLIVFSRLYFNLHYFSDVVWGAVLGYLLGKILISRYEKTSV